MKICEEVETVVDDQDDRWWWMLSFGPGYLLAFGEYFSLVLGLLVGEDVAGGDLVFLDAVTIEIIFSLSGLVFLTLRHSCSFLSLSPYFLSGPTTRGFCSHKLLSPHSNPQPVLLVAQDVDALPEA